MSCCEKNWQENFILNTSIEVIINNTRVRCLFFFIWWENKSSLWRVLQCEVGSGHMSVGIVLADFQQTMHVIALLCISNLCLPLCPCRRTDGSQSCSPIIHANPFIISSSCNVRVPHNEWDSYARSHYMSRVVISEEFSFEDYEEYFQCSKLKCVHCVKLKWG